MKSYIFCIVLVYLLISAEGKHRVKRHDKSTESGVEEEKKESKVDKLLELVKKDKLFDFMRKDKDKAKEVKEPPKEPSPSKQESKEDTPASEGKTEKGNVDKPKQAEPPVKPDSSPVNKEQPKEQHTEPEAKKEGVKKEKKENTHRHNSHRESQKHHDSGDNELKSLHLLKAEKPFFATRSNLKEHEYPGKSLIGGVCSGSCCAARPQQAADGSNDLDVYFYDSLPELFLKPAYKGKKDTTKWIQHRSPIQKAFEIAKLMFKVGLDDADLDDRNSNNNFYYTSNGDESGPGETRSIVMVEGNPNSGNNKPNPYQKYDRSIEKNYFCPVHALQKTIISEPFEVDRDSSVPLLPLGQQMVQVCSCQLMKKQQP